MKRVARCALLAAAACLAIPARGAPAPAPATSRPASRPAARAATQPVGAPGKLAGPPRPKRPALSPRDREVIKHLDLLRDLELLRRLELFLRTR